jgi:hypothetical protein
LDPTNDVTPNDNHQLDVRFQCRDAQRDAVGSFSVTRDERGTNAAAKRRDDDDVNNDASVDNVDFDGC